MQNNTSYTINHTKTRTFVQVPIAGDPNAINTALSALLTQEGYSMTQYAEGSAPELVWKKGTGFATAMKFIKLMYQPNMLLINAWTSSGIGSLTIGEMSLTGGFGAIPKKSCMKTVEKVIQLAQSFGAQPQQNYVPPVQQ